LKGSIRGESGPALNSVIAALILFLTFLLVLAAGIGLSYATAISFLHLIHPTQKPRASLTAATVSSGD
jgi:hypothetical protein